jgi:hypothetical protein
MVDPRAPQISVPLYWSLPGPVNFLAELAQALDTVSPFVVRLNSSEVAGIRQVVRDALHKSCHEPERIEFLEVHEGSHLESDIGHHFGRATVSAAEFANWAMPPRTTIVLTPHSARARERCRYYFEELVKEIASSPKPQARLVLLWSIADDPLPPTAPTEVRFDGALTEDEMHAYVTLRMVGRRGPGSTSLARHLVNEFAGGDTLLAEELMALSPGELLELPSCLAKLTPAVSRLRRDADVLHDWQLAGSLTEAATKARGRLASRYWRACVRSLLPWLEERRRPVIDLLRFDLEDYLYPTKGVWKKANPWRQGETRDIAIDDLEFNDIVAMTFNRDDPFAPSEPRSRQLIEGCKRAKAVRDELAHLRPPDARDIRDLVRTFDDVLVQTR